MKNLVLEEGFVSHGSGKFSIMTNGDVISHESFPCATPGKDFLKTVTREKSLGNIGEEGVATLKKEGFYYLYLFSERPEYMTGFTSKVNSWALLPDTPEVFKKIYLEKYIAFGYFDGQLYGPYTQQNIDDRNESGTTYADKLEYFQLGETEDQAEERLKKEYCIQD